MSPKRTSHLLYIGKFKKVPSLRRKEMSSMYKNRKRFVTGLLIICMSIIPFHSVYAASKTTSYYTDEDTFGNGIMPRYNNVSSVDTQMSISSSGKMTINYCYEGFPSSTTKAVITTYIEKRTLGLFWSRVDIGQTDNQWVDTIAKYTYDGTRTYQLSSSGTYRVTVTYKIYGTGGSTDTITTEVKDSY